MKDSLELFNAITALCHGYIDDHNLETAAVIDVIGALNTALTNSECAMQRCLNTLDKPKVEKLPGSIFTAKDLDYIRDELSKYVNRSNGSKE